MKQQPLWILALVFFYAGCAARPPSETEAVVSRILRERPSDSVCRPPQLSYCLADVDGKKYCSCVNYEDVFAPVQVPGSEQTMR